MHSRQHPATVPFDQLRLSICLLHAIPGAAGSITTLDGETHLVAHHRSDAMVTPCQMRAALLEPLVPGTPHLSDVITAVELVGGAVDLGGGLYQRTHPAGPDERWFVSTLRYEQVLAIAETCPDSIDHDDVSVHVRADADLGAGAVCVSSDRAAGLHLDEVAVWLHCQCLVAELIEAVADVCRG